MASMFFAQPSNESPFYVKQFCILQELEKTYHTNITKCY